MRLDRVLDGQLVEAERARDRLQLLARRLVEPEPRHAPRRFGTRRTVVECRDVRIAHAVAVCRAIDDHWITDLTRAGSASSRSARVSITCVCARSSRSAAVDHDASALAERGRVVAHARQLGRAAARAWRRPRDRPRAVDGRRRAPRRARRRAPAGARAARPRASRPASRSSATVVQHLLLADAPVGLGARLAQAARDDGDEHRDRRVDEKGGDAATGLDRERVVRLAGRRS